MARPLLIAVVILGLLLNGCAASRDVQRVDGQACPANNSHVSWFREHPILTGAGIGLLVTVAVIAAGIIALEVAQPAIMPTG